MSGGSTVVRSEFVSTDPAEVRAVLSRAFAAGLTVAPTGAAPFSFAQRVASDGTVSVSTLRIDGRVTATMDASRDVLFAGVAEGGYRWRSRDRHGDQDRPLILPSLHDLAVEFEDVRSVMLTVDAAVVGRWFARWGGLSGDANVLRSATAGSDPVRDALRFYGRVMSDPTFDSPLVRAGLLDVLLSTSAHHLLPDAQPAQARQAPAALRRAEEFLRAHAAEPISVADAAAAARLSVRGLHDQFYRWLGITPTQYLRNVRLDHVRADLIAAREEGRSDGVAEVARRWGFAHLGRFSGVYAKAFGELPSTTLRG